MPPLPLPVTLATACVLSLIYLALIARVSLARYRYRVSLGDAGNQDILCRVRTHANFAEYVPLILVLMGLVEVSGGQPLVLLAIGGLLAIFRIAHAIGMPMRAPNVFRMVGAGGTFVLLAVLAVWGIVLVLTA